MSATRAELVDMLTTHRHGEDKRACRYCEAFYGGIVDKVFAAVSDPAPGRYAALTAASEDA